LHYSVIDDKRTGEGALFEQLYVCTGLAKQVNNEWLGTRVDLFDNFVEVSVVEEWKNWTKYLLLHQEGFLIWIFDDGGGDEPALSLDAAAVEDSPLMIVLQISLDAVHMKLIDDLAIVTSLLKNLVSPVKKLHL